MATPKWEPGKLYLPGSLVVPRTAPPTVPSTLTNAGFETGDATGWTFDPGFAIANGNPDTGVYCCDQNGSGGVADIYIIHDPYPVNTPGVMVTATCRYAQGAASAGRNPGQVLLRWFDSGMNQIGADVLGGVVNSGSGGAYHTSTVTGAAPVGAAFVSIGGKVHRDAGRSSSFDNFAWNLDTSAVEGLMYKAVQPKTGTSDNVEPVWPAALGVQVIDNDVIWEAVSLSRLVWQARPILRSGATEPTWPTVAGERVGDNTIAWETTSRRVEDANCPNTKVVIIMASKVFAVDGDIIRFSATANPLDWTSEQDAGYLPSGLQSANANDMAVLAQYRGNLVAFNASSFQNWQVDPDPAAMAILDQMEGIGSTWNNAAQPVANELLFLSQRGVRSVGIAAGAENLAAGDVGEPIDVLVQDAVRVAIANGTTFRSTYYPGAGQYWLSVSDYPPAYLAISGDLQDTGTGMPVSYQYTASGGVKPYVFTILSGSLPTGLSMDASGLVTGTPTTVGVYSWTVRVTDADGDTADLPDTAEISQAPTITGNAPDGAVGVAYEGYTYALTGAAPLTVTLRSGSLPPPLVISTAGVLDTGSPTELGTDTFTLRVTDANGLWGELTDIIVIRSFIADNNWYAVSGSVSNGNFVKSPDGLDWSADFISAAPGTAEGYKVVISEHGRVVFCDDDAGRTTDDQGATFTPHTGIGTEQIYRGCFAQGKYFLSATNRNVKASVDGIAWTVATAGQFGGQASEALRAIAGNDNLIVAAGYWPRVSSDAGATWTVGAAAVFSVSYFVNDMACSDSLFIAVGQGNKISSSTGGLVWTPLVSPFAGTPNITSVSYSVANGWVIGSSTGQFAYSSDGVNFTLATDSLGVAVNGIASDPQGLFVAVGPSGNLESSTDKDVWTPRANNFGVNGITDIARAVLND